MSNAEEHRELLDEVEHVLDYQFKDPTLLLAALTHPSAVEGHSLRDSYERLEFLGDSILGAVVLIALSMRIPRSMKEASRASRSLSFRALRSLRRPRA